LSSVLISALALSVVAVGAVVVVRNRVIRRRLRFTLVALLALIALNLAAHHVPPFVSFPQEEGVERLLFALALINLVVTLLFNPWFHDRVSDRSPAIVQDALVLGVFGTAAVFVLHDSTFLTASAIVAAAVGFALQDTLGNAFAGLAIQIEKPFRVGHWISVASYEGLVAEVTWRATKLRTKAGNLVVIPNNVIAKEPINNYSEPAAPTRGAVEVGAAYGAAPNEVREAIVAAMRQVGRVLPAPAADVMLQDFAASAITYRARFWVSDFSQMDDVQTQVRQAIYYEFRRRAIEIPWPIQVQYDRTERPQDASEQRHRFRQAIAANPVLAHLDAGAHEALAGAAQERLFGDGELMVHEGDAGGSMFLVCRGRAAVTVGADAREVATIDAGGYFGEMSLLTGEPRSASVRARGDCVVLEIAAETFGAYVRTHPDVIDLLAAAAVERRRELDATRAAHAAALPEPVSLAGRIRRFFRVHEMRQ
jgi:small-conductance mechanosensitive channel/CRP-like cAMP-binding protein